MGTTADKLNKILESKAAIKAAIEAKGVENVGEVLADYPEKIASISSGSSVGKVDPNSDGTGEIFNDYTNNEATGRYSHVEGYYGEASGDYSHAEGKFTCAKGYGSHAEGYASNIAYGGCGDMTASGKGSHAQNVSTTANTYAQTAAGCRNVPEESPSPTSFNAEKIAFVIGNGTNSAAGNAFYVKFNGETHADGEYSSAGADYAEMFEWLDGNTNNEDRVGRFVTLEGENIRLANSEDTYILGIISGAPTVIGDNPMRWHGKYLNDEWGRPIYEDITRTYMRKQKQEDGTITEVEETKTTHERKINPAYDPMEKYIPRIERPEWDFVGMMGKLLVKQDGTLIKGSFCKPGAEGIATKSDSGYYVMKVVNENQALVLFK